MSSTLIKRITKNQETNELDKKDIISTIDKEILIKIYKDMVRTRAFDNKIGELLRSGHSITQHATTGQEATPVAACANLRKEDYVMPYHRGWAWAIGKGMQPGKMMAELLCKSTGYNKGLAGPQMGSFELGILGRPGIQGAHISIAAGVGLSIKIRKSDQVCLCFFGNGASNTGNFYESINMAATWKVPVVYIVENNLYEIFEKIEDTTSVVDIADRALSHGLDGIIVDGNDAIAVYHVVREAVNKAKRGEGPSLIETKTYRWYGHSPNDSYFYGGYRTKEEVDEWKEKCPLIKMEQDLLAFTLISDSQIEKIKNDAVAEMEKAENYAMESPYPEDEEIFMDNYSD